MADNGGRRRHQYSFSYWNSSNATWQGLKMLKRPHFRVSNSLLEIIEQHFIPLEVFRNLLCRNHSIFFGSRIIINESRTSYGNIFLFIQIYGSLRPLLKKNYGKAHQSELETVRLWSWINVWDCFDFVCRAGNNFGFKSGGYEWKVPLSDGFDQYSVTSLYQVPLLLLLQ